MQRRSSWIEEVTGVDFGGVEEVPATPQSPPSSRRSVVGALLEGDVTGAFRGVVEGSPLVRFADDPPPATEPEPESPGALEARAVDELNSLVEMGFHVEVVGMDEEDDASTATFHISPPHTPHRAWASTPQATPRATPQATSQSSRPSARPSVVGALLQGDITAAYRGIIDGSPLIRFELAADGHMTLDNDQSATGPANVIFVDAAPAGGGRLSFPDPPLSPPPRVVESPKRVPSASAGAPGRSMDALLMASPPLLSDKAAEAERAAAEAEAKEKAIVNEEKRMRRSVFGRQSQQQPQEPQPQEPQQQQQQQQQQQPPTPQAPAAAASTRYSLQTVRHAAERAAHSIEHAVEHAAHSVEHAVAHELALERESHFIGHAVGQMRHSVGHSVASAVAHPSEAAHSARHAAMRAVDQAMHPATAKHDATHARVDATLRPQLQPQPQQPQTQHDHVPVLLEAEAASLAELADMAAADAARVMQQPDSEAHNGAPAVADAPAQQPHGQTPSRHDGAQKPPLPSEPGAKASAGPPGGGRMASVLGRLLNGGHNGSERQVRGDVEEKCQQAKAEAEARARDEARSREEAAFLKKQRKRSAAPAHYQPSLAVSRSPAAVATTVSTSTLGLAASTPSSSAPRRRSVDQLLNG